MSWQDEIDEYVRRVAGVRGSIISGYVELWALGVDCGFDLLMAVHGRAPMTGELLGLSSRFCLHYQTSPDYKREHIWLTFDDIKVGGIHLNHLPPWDVKEDEV